MRILVPLLALLAAPLALAHFPEGTPNTACLSADDHDYAGAAPEWIRDDTRVGPDAFDGAAGSPGCNGGAGDGHDEWGPGAARLLFEAGDGVSSGSLACHGIAPDHAGDIFALDVQAFGPALMVASDWSRAPAPTPDCGDGLLEPCRSIHYPGPSQPFPVSVVEDAAFFLIEEVKWGSSQVCNPNDAWQLFAGNAAGATQASPATAPGADGSYLVFVLPQVGLPPPLAGHVWT